MNVLVIGANGQLGVDVCRALAQSGLTSVAATRRDADLTDNRAIIKLVDRARPDAVVNCAAYHNVAGCEQDRHLARAVNATGVEVLAAAARDAGATFMTVSTDYVFDGKMAGGYTERDEPSPINVYGASKLEGERRALAANPRTFVVRTQSLFGSNGSSGKGLNFVELMLSLAGERDELKVDQHRMAPTSTVSLAANMTSLLQTDRFGLYHMSCDGETSWYEFAKRILELAGSDTKVTPVPNDYYAAGFARPENTYLVNEALRSIDLDKMPHWEDALARYMNERSERLVVNGGSRS